MQTDVIIYIILNRDINSMSEVNILSYNLYIEIVIGSKVTQILKTVDVSNAGNVFNFYVNSKYKKVLINIKSNQTMNIK